MSLDTDVVVVGGGVVGLAAAAALTRAGRSVLLLERNATLGAEVSSRNSEVIHAGIYYPPGSLKARLCVEGRDALYARCRALRIPHRRIGKLVVASELPEVGSLERLHERGVENGVPGLELIDAAALRAREPKLSGVAALVSPETGIIDAAALCRSYAAEAEERGAVILLRHEVVEIEPIRGGYRLAARGPDGVVASVGAAAVVNAAGLSADRVAERVGLDVDALGYRLHPCKGDYFALAPGAPLRLSTLVYPIPAGPGLGVHATLDLAGRLRFGPDAEYVERVRYDVDPAKAEHFARVVGRYLPQLRAEWLLPDYAGVRPRLAGPDEGFRDFVVSEESGAGRAGFVNALGIESPGLTAAPAIADRVVRLLS